MEIRFTEAAGHELDARLNRGDYTLQLVYDTEGCGCAVNGIASLWAIQQQLPDGKVTLAAQSEHYPVMYEKKDEIFFDDRMTVDYLPHTRSFKLSSDGQIFNAHMPLVDKRH